MNEFVKNVLTGALWSVFAVLYTLLITVEAGAIDALIVYGTSFSLMFGIIVLAFTVIAICWGIGHVINSKS